MDTHYPHRVEDLEFLPRSLDGLILMASLPLHVIVASNQSGIAMGYYERADMAHFNSALRAKTEQAGGRIDAFYFCPHLESKHLSPDMTPCACSKPSPGMLLEAAKDFGLDLTGCFVVGDKTSDLAAGESVDCITILVETGRAGREEGALSLQPMYVAEDLLDAAIVVRDCLARDVEVRPDAA